MSGFDKLNNFWQELKKRNVVKALIFYSVSAWLIIQFAATTFPYLNLPKWSVTVVIVALLIGLPIVLMASWIYELTTDGLKKTDSVDRTKSITVKTGKRINRLTIIILSLAVAFLLVDKFYLSAPSNNEVLRSKSIAVFPFSVQGGEDIQYLREGMVDLISTKLDGIPGMNATDPNVLLTRLEQRNINLRDPESAAMVARDLGANRVILGSVTQIGEQLQVKLSKYDGNGKALGETIVENGTQTELYGKVDNVIRKLVAEELEEQGNDTESLAVLSTSSFESLVPFLQGEQLRRKGQYSESLELFKESIDYDSTFTLAYLRYLETAGWLDVVRLENRQTQFVPFIKKLGELKDGLRGKLYDLADAKVSFYGGDAVTESKFRKMLDKYGESRDILNGLAESIFHFRVLENKDAFESRNYFERLLEIDPTNTEYLNHLTDIVSSEGDNERLGALVSRGGTNWEYRPLAEYQSLLLQDSVTDKEILPFTNLPFSGFLMNIRHTIDMPEKLGLIERVLDLSDHPDKGLRFRELEFGRKLLHGQHRSVIDSLLQKARMPDGGYRATDIWLLLAPFQLGYHEIHIMDNHADELIAYIEAAKGGNPFGIPPFIMDYSLGAMHLINNDFQAVDTILSKMKGLFEDNTETPFGPIGGISKIAYYNLQGMGAYKQGDYEKSMAYLDSAVSQGKGVSVAFSPIVMKSRHLYQAEYLVSKQEYSKALVKYKRMLMVDANLQTAGPFWGFLVYTIAGLHDQLGESEEAIAYYKRFATVYANADEVYQSWIDHTYKRLSVLVGRPEGELRGNINDL